jgi:hypothetical protein
MGIYIYYFEEVICIKILSIVLRKLDYICSHNTKSCDDISTFPMPF